MELHQKIAVAVEQGRVQLQRITYNPKGKSTIDPLSQWKPIEHLKPSLGMLMFHVRASNGYADCGNLQPASDALNHAHKMFA